MRKIFICLVLLLSGIIFSHPANGADIASSSSNTSHSINPQKAPIIRDRIPDRVRLENTERSNNIASKGALLREKLQNFKDQTKVNRIEAINSRMALVNKNRTDTMLNRLERMLAILEKIELKAKTFQQNGKDISAVTAAISQARTDITNAQNGIHQQASKDYTIVITNETTAKEDIMSARNTLSNDLKTTSEDVITARKSVSSALEALVRVATQEEAIDG